MILNRLMQELHDEQQGYLQQLKKLRGVDEVILFDATISRESVNRLATILSGIEKKIKKKT